MGHNSSTIKTIKKQAELLDRVMTRVAPFSKLLQITLLRILVIPIGTTSYHPKNERASFHARLAKRAQSFTTIATKHTSQQGALF